MRKSKMIAYRFSFVLILIAVALMATAPAEETAGTDRQQILDAVDPTERKHVEAYLDNNGDTDPVAGGVAKNALNRLARIREHQKPLSRILKRIASDRSVANGTRTYAFTILTQVAARNEDVAAMAKTFATELAGADGDALRPAADRYLKELGEIEERKRQLGPVRLEFLKQTDDARRSPDPRELSDADRLQSLRKSITGAIALLEEQRDKEFFERFIDPFWLVLCHP
jgi:hypothetical protein